MNRPPIETFFKSPIQKDDIEPEEIEVKVIKGKRGEKGDSGKTPTKEELIELIKPLIPEPIPGETGKTPQVKELLPLIKSLIPEVKDGKTPTKEELVELIKPLVPSIQPEVPELTPKEIVEKINKGRTKIKKDKIEGLDELEGRFKGLGNQFQNFTSLGGSRLTNIQSNGVQIGQVDTINFTNGTVVVPVGNNGSTINYTAPTGGSSTFFSDTVSGTINGVNTVFTVPNNISTALALWLANSIYQPGVDFTVTGTKQITMTVAPDISLVGQPFWLSHT